MFGEYPAPRVLAQLTEESLLPAILFRSARKQCDIDVERIGESRVGQLASGQQRDLVEAVDGIIAKYRFEKEVVLAHPHYGILVETGVGAHHAGQLLVWRIVLEELMTRGALRLMIATGTVAAGVDFPARTVVVTAHSKRGNEGFNVLTAAEFQQMSGRAGRRGKDAVGICLVAPGPYSDARVILDVSKRPPEPLRSAYFAAPSTVLNLLKYRNVGELRFVVQKSLAAFLDRKEALSMRSEAIEEQSQLDSDTSLKGESRKRLEKRVRRKLRDAEVLERRQEELLDQSLAGLERLGHVKDGRLTEKGTWAAELCTTLVLELAEAVADHIFDDLPVEILVAMVATISGDPHRPYFALKQNPLSKEQLSSLALVLLRVRQAYQSQSSSEVTVVPDAAVTALTWMESQSWTEFAGYLRLAGVAEGDVARLITQTADHLNQLSRLTRTHPTLAAAAEEGRRRILKPPLSEALIAE